MQMCKDPLSPPTVTSISFLWQYTTMGKHEMQGRAGSFNIGARDKCVLDLGLNVEIRFPHTPLNLKP